MGNYDTKTPLVHIIDSWPDRKKARINDRALLTLRRALAIETGTRTDNTWRLREVAMKSYAAYAADPTRNYDIVPALPEAIDVFLKYLKAEGRKLATLEAYVAHLREIHTLAGYKDDKNPLNSRQVVARLESLRRENTEAQTQDIPVRFTGYDLDGELVLFDKLMDAHYERSDEEFAQEGKGVATKTSLTEKRDKLVLAVAMSTGLRREEVAAITWDHLKVPTAAAEQAYSDDQKRQIQPLVEVPRSKTDQHGKGSQRYLSPLAVRLIREWREEVEQAGYPPFPRVTRHGTMSKSAIGGRTVAEIVKRLTRAAGYGEEVVGRVSGHSTRIGLAQEMAIDGRELPQIMQSMDWKNPATVMKYIRHLMTSDSGSKITLDKMMV